MSSIKRIGFNTQPPEGGWEMLGMGYKHMMVSTHSRLKAAGKCTTPELTRKKKFQHTAA